MSQTDSTRTRVLYLITKGNFGGAQRYVYDLATRLPRDHYEPIVGCGDGDELKQRLVESGVPVRTLSSLKRDIGMFDLRALVEIYQLIRDTRPEVVHLNSSKGGLFGAVAARLFNALHRRKVRVIFTAHGWAFNDARYSVAVRFLFRLLQWLTVLLSHRTVAVSRAIERDMENTPFVQNKLTVIYNGVSEFDRYPREEARTALCPEHPATTWIGTTSELIQNKGIDLAIEAFARIAHQFPHTIFVVLGEGDQRPELEALIRKYDLADRVVLCGHIPHAYRYLEAFDVFSLTSRTEALAYSILEAGMAGLPVVASRVGGIPEVIDDTLSGILVRPGAVREIESALRYMLEQPQKRAEMGAELQTTIQSRFTHERMTHQTLQVYKDV